MVAGEQEEILKAKIGEPGQQPTSTTLVLDRESRRLERLGCSRGGPSQRTAM